MKTHTLPISRQLELGGGDLKVDDRLQRKVLNSENTQAQKAGLEQTP